MATISIIIPNYNSKDTIGKTIKSLANQTYSDFEVVFIDDCSSDNSIEVIERECINENINYSILKNKKNMGPSLSRKKGIEYANGFYITFCDSDDEYHEDYLKSMYSKTNSGTIDLIFCNYVSVYTNGKEVKRDYVSNLINQNKKNIMIGSNDSLCTMMIKKSIMENIEFPDIRNGEDMAIIPIIISKCSNFSYTKEYLYRYNYSSNSLSRNTKKGIIGSLWKSFLYIKENISSNQFNEIEFLGIRNYLYGALLNAFKLSFNHTQVKKIIYDFEIYYPNWEKNQYIYKISFLKRIFLYCAKHNVFAICKSFAILHKYISR